MTSTDAWGTDQSSGFLRHFAGTVKEPYFGTNPQINEGQTLLLTWPTTIDESLQEGFDEKVGEEETLLFSCGKDWETPDGGETAVHRSGNDAKQFHASSAMGMLIDAIIGRVENYGENASRPDNEELEVDMADLADVLRSRGVPTEAAVWDGLRFEFAEVLVDYGPDKKNEGQRIQSKRAMPVKFLGVAGEDKAKAKGSAKKETAAQKKARETREKKAAAKAEASTSSNGDAGADTDPFAGLEVDPALRTQLAELATGSDDHDAFMNAAFDLDEVMEGGDELMTLIAEDGDEGLYARLSA
jgi:hypothetical protein